MITVVRVYGFDTETTPFGVGYTPELKLWCMYSALGEFSGRTARQFRNVVQDMYDDMEEDIIIVAHNLLYDYYFTMFYESLDLWKNSRVTIRVLDTPNYAIFTKQVSSYDRETKKYRKKTYSITFIDLSNYFPGKPTLENVASSMGLPVKLDGSLMFKENLSVDEWILFEKYCMRDAEICYKAFKKINPFINGKLRKTGASLAFGDLKKRSGWERFHRAPWIRQAERSAYLGGRSESNPMYRRQYLQGYKYDVHSMYPFVMYDYKVPIKLLGYAKPGTEFEQQNVFDILTQIYLSDDRTALIQADIILNTNCMPHKSSIKLGCCESKEDEGKLCFDPVGVNGERKKLKNYFSIYELYPAMRDNEIVVKHVYTIILYKTERGKFNPFVDHWYPIKQKARGAEKQRAKLFLNSAYGKFGERKRYTMKFDDEMRDQLERLIDIEGVRYGNMDIYYAPEIGFNNEKIGQNISVLIEGGDFHVTKVIQDDSWGACCIVATEITARARRKLYEEALLPYEWIQVDTDGVVLLEQMDWEMVDNEHQTLGMWGLEECEDEVTGEKYQSCEYISYGKKDYRCLHKKGLKLKGVPKKAREVKEGVWDYEYLIKPKSARRRKNIPVFSLVKMTKRRKY